MFFTSLRTILNNCKNWLSSLIFSVRKEILPPETYAIQKSRSYIARIAAVYRKQSLDLVGISDNGQIMANRNYSGPCSRSTWHIAGGQHMFSE